MINESNLIYPELVGYRVRDNDAPPPSFPENCPVCKAIKITSVFGILGYVKYACGGGYSHKPQIQNHTEYYWGKCGKVLK